MPEGYGRAPPFAARIGLRLGSLESALLAHRRPTDVPSWQVPEIYFDYLRSGDAEELRAVFAHNVEDILSMVSLVGTVDSTMGSWRNPGAVDPHAVAGIGRIHEMDGRFEIAAEAYSAALAESLQPEAAAKYAFSLSLIYKRRKEWSKASSIWEKLAEGKGRAGAAACVELAKYFEHHLYEFGRAYFYCMSADNLAKDLSFPMGGQLSEWALEHRAKRLRRRMNAAHMAASSGLAS